MAYSKGSLERVVCDALQRKGMEYMAAHALSFDIANATATVELAEETLAHAHERREELIRAGAEAGLSYRQLGQYTSLSHQRIGQILNGSGS